MYVYLLQFLTTFSGLVLNHIISPLHHIISPLHHIISSLHHIISPLHHIISPLHHIISPLHHIVPPLHHIISPLHHIIPPLHHIIPPLHHIIPPLHLIISPLHHTVPVTSCQTSLLRTWTSPTLSLQTIWKTSRRSGLRLVFSLIAAKTMMGVSDQPIALSPPLVLFAYQCTLRRIFLDSAKDLVS